jgi:hypothetical protein
MHWSCQRERRANIAQEAQLPEVTVYDDKGRAVGAKILRDPTGSPILEPITGLPLIVDEDFDMDRAIAFGRSLADPPVDPYSQNLLLEKKAAVYGAMINAFQDGGPLDMQRSYNKIGGRARRYVKAFRPAANYVFGAVARAAALSPEEIMAGGGVYNLSRYLSNPNANISGPWGNAPPNVPWIEAGIKDHDSGRFFIPGKRGAADLLPTEAARKVDPNAPDDGVALGQESSEQGRPQIPTKSGATDPQPLNPQFASVAQAGRASHAALSPGLRQHVIDTGNYLRANGFEITPRSMYVASVLGPRGAVDLFKRTGSTSSDAVQSPDAATGQQMRAWARQLRLGPAAASGPPAAPDFAAPAPPVPAAQAAWSDAGATPPGDASEDAGLPAFAPAEPAI